MQLSLSTAESQNNFMEEKQFVELKSSLDHIEALLEFLCKQAISIKDRSYVQYQACDSETARLFAEGRKIPEKKEHLDAY